MMAEVFLHINHGMMKSSKFVAKSFKSVQVIGTQKFILHCCGAYHSMCTHNLDIIVLLLSNFEDILMTLFRVDR